MLDYGDFYFASAPRVGVSWFVKACQLSALGPAFVKESKPRDDGTFRVSLIRHPVSWLESVFAARQVGCHNVFLGKFLTLGIEDGLEAFIWQYLQEMPGEVGIMMLKYEANSIMRIEDTPWVFLEFASAIGIDPKFFPNIEKMGRINANPHVQRMSKAHSVRVTEAEKELCHEYEYF